LLKLLPDLSRRADAPHRRTVLTVFGKIQPFFHIPKQFSLRSTPSSPAPPFFFDSRGLRTHFDTLSRFTISTGNEGHRPTLAARRYPLSLRHDTLFFLLLENFLILTKIHPPRRLFGPFSVLLLHQRHASSSRLPRMDIPFLSDDYQLIINHITQQL
jgi:hypothetical protein